MLVSVVKENILTQLIPSYSADLNYVELTPSAGK